MYNGSMQIEKLIKTKKLKCTPARKILLEIFSQASQPCSYEDIKSKIAMDKATFYRNMIIFENLGMINGFESHKKRYYEMSDKLHSHFICSQCHKIECLEEDTKFSLKGCKVDNIIIHGVCRNCL